MTGMRSRQRREYIPSNARPLFLIERLQHQINLAEDQQNTINPTPHPDDDLDLFNPYVKRFGKLKEPVVAALRAELERLGGERVGEVLERCCENRTLLGLRAEGAR